MKQVLAALVLLGCAMGAQASEGSYFGTVVGLMATDIRGDSPFNAGARVGRTWSSGWGVEGEATTSLSKGSYDFDTFYGSRTVDYSITTVALYGTYRSQGDIYFKGRLGVLNESVDFGGSSASEAGLSLGLGAGFNVSESMNFEAEYTLVEEDVNLWSGTLVFRF
uniref:outer membrane beta-barrel protein n=1 Tax=Microbulbifer agarilyticus TaxID=260552 RepID=UPI000255BC2A|nr:outer membrane beta-barrel protein [Microbulbifer agarilyticus]